MVALPKSDKKAIIQAMRKRFIAIVAALSESLATFLLVAALPLSSFALDPFEEMERHMAEMRERMQNAMSVSFNGAPVEQLKIVARASVTNSSVSVGESFDVLFELEAPNNCSLSNLRIGASRTVALEMLYDKAANLADSKSSIASNVVKRFVLPIRYHAPFEGGVKFTIQGYAERAIRKRGFSSSFSTSFGVETDYVPLCVKPLAGVDVPKDFTGIVGSRFSLSQSSDMSEVETNDVVLITAVLRHNGYIPDGALGNIVGMDSGVVAFRRYFVADGRTKTDEISIPYYDVESKSFKRVSAPGRKLKYVSSKETSSAAVVVNGESANLKADGIKIRFAPRESAREIGLVKRSSPKWTISEEYQGWVRVDDGEHAGWVKKEDLQ